MSPLPRPVVWIIGRVVPSRGVTTVLTDLEDDYAAVRSTRAALPAAWWLTRETVSLVMAYVGAPLARVKGWIPMWLRDLRLVVRGLRRHPLAALGAAAMLSSGLLALLITAGLSSALLFRPISAAHGDALRRVAAVDRQGRTSYRMSYPEFQLVRERLGDAAAVTSVTLQPVMLRAHNVDLQTMAEVVDGQYFALTGMTTRVGRGLIAADDRADAPRVVVISEPLWRQRFSASPDVLGQSITLNGAPSTIIGVAGVLGSSSFLGASVDAWVPTAHADSLLNRGWRTNPADRWLTGYVLPSTQVAEIDARLAAAGADLTAIYPELWRERRLQTAPGTVLVGAQRATVTTLAAILAGFAVLILAVAGANVGGLLLARAAADRRHAAIHLSLGSGRGAVARRLLIEGTALGIAGGGIALAMYVWARTSFESITVLPTLAIRLSLPLDAGVMLLIVAAGAASGLLLAVGPAIWASRLDLSGALRDAGPRASGGRGLARTRHVLVSAQVCLSLALVVSAALFTRSLDALATVDVGFSRDRLVALDFDVEPLQPAMNELPLLAREAMTRVAQIPGISSVAMSNRAPIDMSTPAIDVRDGASGTATVGDVSFYLATEGYFETVGLPLVAGRAFTATEVQSNADVVIVNETLAERLWGVHREIREARVGDVLDRALYLVAEAKTVRVVGVARNSKYRTLSEPARPHLYRPTSPRLGLALLARTSGNPYEALGAIQRTLDGVGPGLVGFFPRTLDDHLAIDVLPTRAAARAAIALGTLALALSAVGLYGLVAWFVELRRREIGVRMALGATAANVRALVVGQALGTAIPGIACGLLLAVVLAVVARSALFGVRPLDPVALGAGVAALAVVVVAASYLPSRRATRVDPAVALRQ